MTKSKLFLVISILANICVLLAYKISRAEYKDFEGVGWIIPIFVLSVFTFLFSLLSIVASSIYLISQKNNKVIHYLTLFFGIFALVILSLMFFLFVVL